MQTRWPGPQGNVQDLLRAGHTCWPPGRGATPTKSFKTYSRDSRQVPSLRHAAGTAPCAAEWKRARARGRECTAQSQFRRLVSAPLTRGLAGAVPRAEACLAVSPDSAHWVPSDVASRPEAGGERGARRPSDSQDGSRGSPAPRPGPGAARSPVLSAKRTVRRGLRIKNLGPDWSSCVSPGLLFQCGVLNQCGFFFQRVIGSHPFSLL